MTCLDDDDVARFVSEPSASPWREERERHIDACGTCRARVALAMIDLGSDATATTEPLRSANAAHEHEPAGSTIQSEPFRFGAGDVVGGHRLVAPLGRGGMGIVFEAIELVTGEARALKFLLTPGGKNERRALREALAMGIEHPAIVPIVDVLHDVDVAPVLVMPRLYGRSLAKHLDDPSRLPLAEVCRIVTALLEALCAIHEGGAVHRDIKPANVFVEDSGAVRILDFGLVWLDAERMPLVTLTRLTTTATIVGTPRYLAPEVVHGAPADARADLWGVGHVAFELLTGERAIHARHAGGFLREIARAEPIARADARAPSVPAPIADVVATLLEKDPDRRAPSSAVALARWRAAVSAVQPMRGPLGGAGGSGA